VGSEAEPQPKSNLVHFSAGDEGDFSDAAGEREMAPKCGSLPRDAGDLVAAVTQNNKDYVAHHLRDVTQ